MDKKLRWRNPESWIVKCKYKIATMQLTQLIERELTKERDLIRGFR